MNDRFRFVIERKNSLVFLVLFCALIGGFAAFNLRQSFVQAQDKVKERISGTSYLISEWVRGSFDVTDLLLMDIVGHVRKKDIVYPHPDPVDQARLTTLITAKMSSVPNVILVGLFDQNCILTHGNKTPPGWDGSQRDYCKKLRVDPNRKTWVTNSYVSSTGPLNVTQSRRYLPSDSAFQGFAAVGVDLTFFSKWLSKVTTEPHGVIAIVDQNISLLARKPAKPEALGKRLNDPIVLAFLASGETYKTFRATSPLDGEPRMYGVRKLNDLPFVIVVGEADRDWQADWMQNLWMTVGGVAFLWLLAFMTLRFYWSRLEIAHREASRERGVRREQEQLLHMIGHEVRTPIAIISSALDSLRLIEKDSSPNVTKQQRYERIDKAVRRMEMLMQLVDTEQRCSKEVGQNAVFQKLDMHALCKENLDLLTDAKGRIELHKSAGSALLVSGDPNLLGFLVLNLFDNALKYAMSRDSIQARLSDSLREGKSGVLLSVCNQAKAFAPGMEERIFEKYVRIDEQRGQPGLGLGLYLSRRIALQHGGSLSAKNMNEHAVCFELWIPQWTRDASS